MKIENEQHIIELVKSDGWMMEVLETAKLLDLPDWWVCAGFVRSKIWDELHGYKQRTVTPDVDVIYYDNKNIDEALEKIYEQRLLEINPHIPWSVKNEARMHLVNNDGTPPYTSSTDAISKFPETATALGVTLDKHNEVVLTAPCGIEDVINLVVKPTPYFANHAERLLTYKQRITKKNWQAIWPLIKVDN